MTKSGGVAWRFEVNRAILGIDLRYFLVLQEQIKLKTSICGEINKL